LSGEPKKINVKIKYGEVAQEFTAEPQQAWLLLGKFFNDLIPAFEVAQKLRLQVDLQQLAKDLEGIVAFSGDGANLLVSKAKITDNEALSVWLTAYFLGHKLGLVANDSLSKDELQLKLGKSGKITSTRLGELVKNEIAVKTADDNFRITVFGVVQTQREVIPRVRSKTSI
jgi:hypothetical protein